MILLKKNHQHEISYNTLLRRLKLYGMKRRNNFHDNERLERVYQRMKELVNGPSSCAGYRTMWHTLEMEGLSVPRMFIQCALKDIDPEGSENRRRHRLKRRQYVNDGPNFAWHIDGYDKLKPWGFPIHGAIDGFSRKVLWLKVLHSNNSPDNIAALYISNVEIFGGCPVELITDLGTENGLAAAIQCFFRQTPDAHRYCMFHFLVINELKLGGLNYVSREHLGGDLIFQTWNPIIFSTLHSHKEALWFCYSNILQKDLDFMLQHWNSHYIRKSRHGAIGGRPDILYSLPENFGASECKISVSNEDIYIAYSKEHILKVQPVSIPQEYFRYVLQNYPLNEPNSWGEAESLFKKLIEICVDGEY